MLPSSQGGERGGASGTDDVGDGAGLRDPGGRRRGCSRSGGRGESRGLGDGGPPQRGARRRRSHDGNRAVLRRRGTTPAGDRLDREYRPGRRVQACPRGHRGRLHPAYRRGRSGRRRPARHRLWHDPSARIPVNGGLGGGPGRPRARRGASRRRLARGRGSAGRAAGRRRRGRSARRRHGREPAAARSGDSRGWARISGRPRNGVTRRRPRRTPANAKAICPAV